MKSLGNFKSLESSGCPTFCPKVSKAILHDLELRNNLAKVIPKRKVLFASQKIQRKLHQTTSSIEVIFTKNCRDSLVESNRDHLFQKTFSSEMILREKSKN